MRVQRERHQAGSVYEASGKFYIRYRSTEIIDGAPQRVQKSEALCEKDVQHYSIDCKAVRMLRDEFMLKVNARTADNPTVAAFYEGVYLPWAKTINPKVGEPNLRPSTLTGYEQIWAQHLKAHFGNKTLRQYQTAHATDLLTELAAKVGRNTVAHVRSLMSGIFSLAIAKGYLEENPLKGAFSLTKTAAPKKTRHYTLTEVLGILKALADKPECQLVMALACFLGLRPGEIRGLRWEDFVGMSSDECPICQDEQWDISVPHVHVRRSVDKGGNVTKPKTEESEGPLPLMIPVSMPLSVWRDMCGNPDEGWVFATKRNTSVDLRDWVRNRIKPALSEAKIDFKTLYAGRRGAATLLLRLTGNALASQQLLRHAPGSAVTAKHYLKAIPEALLRGSQMVEEEVQKAMAAAEK